MHVLIVEDHPVTSRLLKDILKPYAECEIVDSGSEAILAFDNALKKNKPFDLICMDIMMPNMNGHVALMQIREKEKKAGIAEDKEVKVIMVTGLDDGKNVVKAYYEGGATSYIVKPIDKDKFLDELRNIGLIE